jgi:hypothetical protein
MSAHAAGFSSVIMEIHLSTSHLRTSPLPDLSQSQNRLLDSAEASSYLKSAYNLEYSPRTLSNLRWAGNGPRFFKANANRALYSVAELDFWAETKIGPLRGSTSDSAEG